jgi:hypothetical protein
MYVCQWHLDTPFGKQKDVLELMKKWDTEMENSGVAKLISRRTMVGHIGTSPSHIINEYVVASLAEWEAMLKAVGTGKFQQHSTALAPFVVPGSQHWVVLRIAD